MKKPWHDDAKIGRSEARKSDKRRNEFLIYSVLLLFLNLHFADNMPADKQDDLLLSLARGGRQLQHGLGRGRFTGQ